MACNQPSAPVTLAVCGDPFVSRALVVLLRGTRYDARVLTTSSLGVAEALDGVQLVLLSPMPQLSAMRRETLVAALMESAAVAGIPILELVVYSGGAREEEGRVGARSPREVSWPWSLEKLEQDIEDALRADHGSYRGARRHSRARNG